MTEAELKAEANKQGNAIYPIKATYHGDEKAIVRSERVAYKKGFQEGAQWQSSQRDEEMEEMLGLDNPLALHEVLQKLIDGTELLLGRHSYDGHDYEEMELSVKRAKETIEQIEQFLNRKK